jgi:hypothetical protein
VRLLLIAFAMALLASSAWADSTIVPDPTLTPDGGGLGRGIRPVLQFASRQLLPATRRSDDAKMTDTTIVPGIIALAICFIVAALVIGAPPTRDKAYRRTDMWSRVAR